MAAAHDKSGDILLWIGAGAVAAMGIVWLLIASPWSEPEPTAELGMAPAGADMPPSAGATTPPAADALRTARLALEAGMLIEPEGFSAWALYGEAVAADPGNADAREGLEQVAAALLQRGRTAHEQGRYDAAKSLAETVMTRLPEHTEAAELAALVEAATAPRPEPAPARAPSRAARDAAPAAPDPALAVAERMAELHEAFRDAMGRNEVLAPPGNNAREIVDTMLALSAEHELAEAARDLLVTEMLDRSAQSLEALDVEAARTWIDAAGPLARDPLRVERARSRLVDHLIAAESAKPLPTSELTLRHYVAPEYPSTALSRGSEGWVDVEFTVSPLGKTEDVTVTDASHARLFREEAVAAVAAWEFEPVIFMERAIAQRSYTRVAFVID